MQSGSYPDKLAPRAKIQILPRAYVGWVIELQKDGESQQAQDGLGLR